ncbi:MAG: DegT/DnrJ/EryC1/StrS family aminotransferase [Desulfobacter sp.]
MNIPFVDLASEYRPIKAAVMAEIENVLDSGQYIGGRQVEELEQAIAGYCGTRFAITVNSGTDALFFSLLALGIGNGDEVIVPSNSFMATANAVILAGATPVFADIESGDINIDPACIKSAITPETRAVIPVHLSGKPARMDQISDICADKGIFVIEDAAQAFGAELKGKKAGSMGDTGCFSFHPLKNLNCPGDGGCIVTDNQALAGQLKLLRNHGLKDRDTCILPGYNSRLDAIHAAILKIKLARYEETLAPRLETIQWYREQLDGHIGLIPELEDGRAVYQNFFLFSPERDALRNHLDANGIASSIHSHTTPLHQQPGIMERSRVAGSLDRTRVFQDTTLSIPVLHRNPEARDHLIQCILDFCGRRT